MRLDPSTALGMTLDLGKSARASSVQLPGAG